MANKYHIFVGGSKDAKGNYVGGTLDATFTTEREAFYHEKKLQWERKPDLIYMLVEGDERFMIVQTDDPDLPFHVVDKRTQGWCYGVCRTMQEAIEAKAWDEKYHYEHWYKEYYDQSKAA